MDAAEQSRQWLSIVVRRSIDLFVLAWKASNDDDDDD
jgi:hypothetical protein